MKIQHTDMAISTSSEKGKNSTAKCEGKDAQWSATWTINYIICSVCYRIGTRERVPPPLYYMTWQKHTILLYLPLNSEHKCKTQQQPSNYEHSKHNASVCMCDVIKNHKNTVFFLLEKFDFGNDYDAWRLIFSTQNSFI